MIIVETIADPMKGLRKERKQNEIFFAVDGIISGMKRKTWKQFSLFTKDTNNVWEG